jgi:sec-independent protein translocase protein TatA
MGIPWMPANQEQVMGLGGIGFWQLLIILAIIMMVFGTKKLRNIGSDLGGAIKGFKNAMDEGNDQAKRDQLTDGDNTIDVKAEKIEEKN